MEKALGYVILQMSQCIVCHKLHCYCCRASVKKLTSKW